MHVENPLWCGYRVHEWRRDLCNGKVQKGLDWVGSNNMYCIPTLRVGSSAGMAPVWGPDCTVPELWGQSAVEGDREVVETVVGGVTVRWDSLKDMLWEWAGVFLTTVGALAGRLLLLMIGKCCVSAAINRMCARK
jgi:hypothetical protein